MRPLKLEISAFCSYSGRTVIDMEKLRRMIRRSFSCRNRKNDEIE